NVTASIKVQDQTPVAGEEWTIQIVVSFFEGIPAGGSFEPLVLLEPGFLDPLAGVSDAIVNGSIEFNDESNFLVMQFDLFSDDELGGIGVGVGGVCRDAPCHSLIEDGTFQQMPGTDITVGLDANTIATFHVY